MIEDLMEQPAVTRAGATYERAAIADWLSRGHRHDPATRQPLRGEVGVWQKSAKRSERASERVEGGRGAGAGGGGWHVLSDTAWYH